MTPPKTGINEVSGTTLGRYALAFLLVGVGIGCWVCVDARRRNNERAATVGGGLLVALYVISAPGILALERVGLGEGALLFAVMAVVSLSLVAFGTGTGCTAPRTHATTGTPRRGESSSAP